MTYSPKPGSVAERCVQFLQQHVGVPMSSAEIGDAVGCKSTNIGGNLAFPVRHGLVRKTMKSGVVVFVADQPAPPRPAAEDAAASDEVDNAPPIHRRVPAAEAGALDWTPSPLDAAWHPPCAGRGVDIDAIHNRDTPPKGADRVQQVLKAEPETADATDREARSEVMALEGSESPTGRVLSEPALGAAPVFIQPGPRGTAAINGACDDDESDSGRARGMAGAGSAIATGPGRRPGAAGPGDRGAEHQAGLLRAQPHGAAHQGNAQRAGVDLIRFALWSDGTLQIERKTVGGAADLVLLAAHETRQLVHYLERMAEVSA